MNHQEPGREYINLEMERVGDRLELIQGWRIELYHQREALEDRLKNGIPGVTLDRPMIFKRLEEIERKIFIVDQETAMLHKNLDNLDRSGHPRSFTARRQETRK